MKVLLKLAIRLKKARFNHVVVKRAIFWTLIITLLAINKAQSGYKTPNQSSSLCPYSFSVVRSDAQSIIRCWTHKLYGIVQAQGLNAGLEYLENESANSLDFQSNCHNLAHYLGGRSYDLLLKQEPISTPNIHLCGNGFYHGFVARAVKENGDLSAVIKICRTASSNMAIDHLDECMHGVGHGLAEDLAPYDLDTPQAKISTGLKACRDLNVEEVGERSCEVGIYGWVINQSKNFFKTYIPPLELCRRQSGDSTGACLHAAVRHVIGLEISHPEELGSMLGQIPDNNWSALVTNLVGMEGGYGVKKSSDVEGELKFCRLLDQRLSSECFRGFVKAIKNTAQSYSQQAWASTICDDPVLTHQERQICPSIN